MPPRRNVPANDGANENNAPTNAQLAHGLQQLTQLTQLLGNALLQNGNGNDVAKRVAERHPPTFLGQEDPRVLEDWIGTFDKLLDAVGCPMEQKVDTAVYYLQQEADMWWLTNGQALRQQPDFDWETFKTAMRDRFYPEHVMMEKYEEFLNLKQGNMAVQEYHTKFLEFARFAPSLVPDEYNKAQKFIRGLNFETQKAVCVLGCQTLNEAYNRAANHYRVYQMQKDILGKNKKMMDENAEDNRQGGKRPKFNNQGSNWNFQGNRNGNGQGQGQGQVGRNHGYNRHFYCKTCGGDHPGTDCQGNLVQCYKCNMNGHRAFECRVKGNDQGQGSNGENQKGARQGNNGTGNRGPNGGNNNGNNQAANNRSQNNNGGNNNQAQANASDVVSAAVQDFIPLSVENCVSIKPRLAKHQSIFPFNLSRLGNNFHRKRSRESLDLDNPSPEIGKIISHHAQKLRIEFEEKLREKDEEIRRLGRLKLALRGESDIARRRQYSRLPRSGGARRVVLWNCGSNDVVVAQENVGSDRLCRRVKHFLTF